MAAAKKKSTGRKHAASTLNIGRGAAVSIGAAAVVAGAALFEAWRRGAIALPGGGNTNEHVPTDLMGETRPGPDDRAPEDFRPDPTAIPSADEREQFRPALATADR